MERKELSVAEDEGSAEVMPHDLVTEGPFTCEHATRFGVMLAIGLAAPVRRYPTALECTTPAKKPPACSISAVVGKASLCSKGRVCFRGRV